MRGRLSYANVAATVAIIIAVAGGGAAIAEPVATGIASSAHSGASSAVAFAKRALGISKRANRRSVHAIRGARRAIGEARGAQAGAQAASAEAATATSGAAAASNRAGQASQQASAAMDLAQSANARALDTWTKSESDERFLGVEAQATDSALLAGMGPEAFGRAGGSASPSSPLGFPPTVNQNCHSAGDAIEVTVDVPAHGLVAAYVSADLAAGVSNGIGIQIHEPTSLPDCVRVLFQTDPFIATVRTVPGSTSGTTSPIGGMVVLNVAPGERTFSIRYQIVAGAVGATPSRDDLLLYVKPL